MIDLKNTYKGLKVFITGHTGFKGTWLAIWLKQLGAVVTGYSLEPPTTPNIFTICDLKNEIQHIHGDILDFEKLDKSIKECQPDLIFHLAAQSLVIDSYLSPRETFHANSQGTVNVLESGVQTSSVKGMILVTTDKVYENVGWPWGYRENDRLGGHDPYSASKAMAEIAIESYRKSFSNKNREIGIASARSGNVIGGGDFSKNRLLPDIIRAFSQNQPLFLRHPQSVRPWMYVLDSLHGYLTLGAHLLKDPLKYGEAWNFAPKESFAVSCEEIVDKASECWGKGEWYTNNETRTYKEMADLRLSGEKAYRLLNWAPKFDIATSIYETISWHRQQMLDENMYEVTLSQIDAYMNAERNRVNI